MGERRDMDDGNGKTMSMVKRAEVRRTPNGTQQIFTQSRTMVSSSGFSSPIMGGINVEQTIANAKAQAKQMAKGFRGDVTGSMFKAINQRERNGNVGMPFGKDAFHKTAEMHGDDGKGGTFTRKVEMSRSTGPGMTSFSTNTSS